MFAANGVTVLRDAPGAYTPTPAVSHAVLAHNRRHGRTAPADGVVITPSHNPPGDGGYKYNEPHGGPASATTTAWIERRANALIAGGLTEVRRMSSARAEASDTTGRHDFLGAYVDELASVLDLDAVRASGVRIGADPLGGASVAYWGRIAEQYGLDLTVLDERTDPTWWFLAPDKDGKLRTDCSSPHTMAQVTERRHRFDVIVANDADADRHSIVTPDGGLLPANHYQAVAAAHLHAHRDRWPTAAGIGKSVVTTALMDRVAADLGRPLVEVPVGFKWFTEGLRSGRLCWGGEESAGASFLRRDGSVWTTDKDGIVPALLAAEIIAVSGTSPSAHWEGITDRLGGLTTSGPTPPPRPGSGPRSPDCPPTGCREAARGRGRHVGAHTRPGQRHTAGRHQGVDPQRLVRGPAFRHGARPQGLRRVLPRPRPSGTCPRRGTGDGGQGDQGLTARPPRRGIREVFNRFVMRLNTIPRPRPRCPTWKLNT